VDTMRIRAVTDETERRVLALSTSDHRCLLADDSNGVTSWDAPVFGASRYWSRWVCEQR